MRFYPCALAGVTLIEPERHADDRGHFARTFCEREFAEHGLVGRFVQCGTAFNARAGTVRGMHLQRDPHGEFKLIRCTRGAVVDVVADLRADSRTYLQCVRVEMSEDDGRQLYVPPGVAHGYQSLVDATELHYMISAFHAPQAATGVRWDDPALGIAWPLPIGAISERDRGWPDIADAKA